MAPHAGVIIAASVLVAASLAAYENPEFRAWIERSSQKVAMAFRSLGDDIHGRRRRQPSRTDSSMHEDADAQAEERRRQARQEIMERGRVLQERKRRRRGSKETDRTSSFDSLVDEDGKLRPESESNPWAQSTGVTRDNNTGLRSRQNHPEMHESVDAPILLRQLAPDQRPAPAVPAIEPWESQYEQEMRNAWNIQLPAPGLQQANSHASESLIDLTPTTEDFPDPDYSVPSLMDAQRPMSRTEYFSTVNSQTSHTLSNDAGEVDLRDPLTPLEPRPFSPPTNEHFMPSTVPSSRASAAGSTSHIRHSEAELSDDDISDSEFGDGIRTPGSAWTEVASSVSGDDLPQ